MVSAKRKLPTNPSIAQAKVVVKKARSAPKEASSSENESLDTSISDEDESQDDLDQLASIPIDKNEDQDEVSGSDDVGDDGTANSSADPALRRKPLPLDPHKEAASREAHIKQKEKLNERKASKPHADTLARSKKLWAQLNRKKVPKTERQKIIDELYGLIKGSVVEIIFKHDASRVVQASFKFGSEEQRTTILNELKGRLVELSKSTYGKFLVVKMLFYGTNVHRGLILSELHGNVRKLIKHKEAAYVIEDAFREYTTPAQQESLVSEMYGAEYSVFESTGSKSLKDLLAASPEKRDTIMKNLWDSIEGSVKKGSIGFTIIHRALLSFLQNANTPERVQVIELIKELLPEIVHTKDGSEVASYVIALSAAKERKAIMKSFREHIVKAMCDEYGWIVVISLCMCVDDTVLLTKAYIPDIEKKCLDLFENKNARKVFLYLLGDVQARYLTARDLHVLEEVNGLKQTTSKKDDQLRRKEILQPLSRVLVATLIDNMDGMLRDPNASSLLVEIILHAPTDRDAAISALLEKFTNSPEDVLIEHTARFLKTLVQGGFYNKTTGIIERIDPSIQFGDKFAPIVSERAAAWSSGDGSFVVVALLENLDSEAPELIALKHAILASRADVEEAASKGNKGSKIILTKI